MMLSFAELYIWLMIVSSITCLIPALSYNQPKFCSNASWNPNATTFADNSTIGSNVYGIFVNTNNTVYVADQSNNRILIWLEGTINISRIISGDLKYPVSLFVTITGDIYVDNGNSSGRVDKWVANATNSTSAMHVGGSCFGLFVDIKNNLYCSLRDRHQVVMASLNSSVTTPTTVAGENGAGSASDQLHLPVGIFVDINLNLYVADYGNKRIQLFPTGQRSATTKVGNGASGTITLSGPTGVVLDGDGYLFIVDRDGQSVIGPGPNGFRCIVGCSTNSGSLSNQLNNPRTLRFDSYGNMFVADTLNNRIQKFILATNSCDETTTFQAAMTSTVATGETSMNVVPYTNLSTSTAVINHTNNSHSTKITTTSEASSVTDSTDNVKIFLKDSTSLYSTISSGTVNAPASSFVLPSCPNQNRIGIGCNISTNPCEMLTPCQNTGTCININTSLLGYNCSCPSGFNGINCEIDIRPCKPNTCWNNGICNETSDTAFKCSCQPGWTSIHCETKISYCENVKCLNNGVCRPLLLNFTCECLGTSYSGRYCEITSTQTVVYQTVSKSFGYIAVLFLAAVALFIIIIDILKYGFKIDPTKDELEKIRRKKRPKRRKPPPVILRFIYVNAPTPARTNEERISTVQETIV